MSSKSISMIKKQRIIKEELTKFPTFGHRSQSQLRKEFAQKAIEKSSKENSKKKTGLQKGKSLQIERPKVLIGTLNNFKKTIENIKLKNSAIIKKKTIKLSKEQSLSRASLVSSDNLQSLPSTTILNCESQIIRLNDQNKKYKQIIEKQKAHIRSLQFIIAQI